jgi:hypothetical protein
LLLAMWGLLVLFLKNHSTSNRRLKGQKSPRKSPRQLKN